ncbi:MULTISPECIES: NADPH:quinone reductase [unclassified Beijerinckia]|uniref:NADPH:quinone reductase n=1 Tax=unclassified Beijerinckia TaxID=2638183 RepID=UPI000894D72F|nr:MULTISPECIES: NADPH:quinone reductase [unclassified Beijerinckia]MDH7797922.1 NADPH2:quinone reductase [Beijerinckia sp. GAS462]SED02954.1 NADPH2:quinone reductase [Beijerinckia sp. 28-YEA-48]
MLAGWYERCGPADEVISVGEIEKPLAGPGEVLVRVHASGINPSDYKRRANVKAGMEFPRIVPHSDGAGTVAALGPGVSNYRVGDRVWMFNAQWARPMGSAAEFVSLPATLIRPLPNCVSFEEGACLGIPAMTAYHAIFRDGPVKGQTIYVPAATGRVGAYAIQFARWGGARVIASTGSRDKMDAIKALGADVVLDRNSDLSKSILEHADGRGVDRVIEIDFGHQIGFDEQIVAEGGTIVSYGAAAPGKAEITLSPRRARNMSVHFIFVYMLSDAQKQTTCDGILQAIRDKALRHRIAGTVPLMDLARAHREAESQAGTGHMVVTL